MIGTVSEAHKTNLRTGTLGERDLRLFLDPRQIEYPDLGTGNAQYTFAREDNLIDRGNCEFPIAPMLLGETVPLSTGAAFARSLDIAHGGGYSYKFTKNVAAGGGDFSSYALQTDNVDAGNMHGFIAGESYKISLWIYIPIGSGITGDEIRLRTLAGGGATTQNTYITPSNTYDKWQEVTTTFEINGDQTYTFIGLYARSTAADTEYFYVDDYKVSSHAVPGSHYLSAGHIETLCPMTEKFTFRVKFLSKFAYDVGTNQFVGGWNVGANQFLQIRYNQSSDRFRIVWNDGGSARYLSSAIYDNGATYRNINQYIELTGAIDLSTGTIDGSALWMNKTQDDITWTGAIPAKSTEFNKLQIRAYDGTAGAFDIAYFLLIPGVVATDAQVQNDFKDIQAEEIFFPLDGHGTGRTRVNINTVDHRCLQHYDLFKGINGKLIQSAGANTLNFSLFNDNGPGEFSDDQYAAWDPENNIYNGLSTQAYLAKRFGVMAESWYDGDFDYVFVGRMTEDGLKRQAMNDKYSKVRGSAEDGVGDLDRYFEKNGRVFPAAMLARQNTLIDRGGCESTVPPMIAGELVPLLTGATFARTADDSYHGRYCYKLTVTGASYAYGRMANNADTDDMHGFVAGATYTMRAKVKAITGDITADDIYIQLQQYYSGSWHYSQAYAINTYDEWQSLEFRETVSSIATAVVPMVMIDVTAVATDYCYVDQIELIPDDESEATDRSLFHLIAKQGYRKQIQYLSNNSFENATIANSWMVTTGGAITRDADAADAFFGSYSCEFVPGLAAEQVYQYVAFTGTRKLNVGDKFTYWCWLKSAGAISSISNYIVIFEKLGSGIKDSTSEAYVLAGGEGYKLFSVTHTITDSTSDRLQVKVGGDAGDTINIGGMMLAQADRALNYFEANTEDGAAGVSYADDGDEISWPWFGIHTGNVDTIHPWRRMDKNTTVWMNLKSVGAGTGAHYCGFNEAGTLINKAILDNDYSDQVPVGQVTETGTDLYPILKDGLTVFLDALQANAIYGSGDRYEVSTIERLISLASAAGNFTDSLGNNRVRETVLNGGFFPDKDKYGEYWFRYGAAGKVGLRKDSLTEFPFGVYALLKGGSLNAYQQVYWQNQADQVVDIASKDGRIVGVQDATLYHKTAETGAAVGDLTGVTSGTLVSGLDITSRNGEARILLENLTGTSRLVMEAALVGKPVYQFTGDEGFINDSLIDFADIMKNGDRLLKFGGGDVVDGSVNGQLDKLVDFLWKDRATRKHVYVGAFYGAMHDVGANDWMGILVGAAGKNEFISSTATATGIRISANAETQGKTEITFREVTEGWKNDSNAATRFIVRGVPIHSPSTSGVVTIGAAYTDLDTDYRIPITYTTAQVIINRAIKDVSDTGGGRVRVLDGTYITSAAIEILDNVILELAPAAIIEKNANDYAIKCVGTGGSHITNAGLIGGRVTRNSSDTNDIALVALEFADDFTLSDVTCEDAYSGAFIFTNVERITASNIRVNGFGTGGVSYAVWAFSGSGIINGVIVDGESAAKTVVIYGVEHSGDFDFRNVIVKNLNSSDAIRGFNNSSNDAHIAGLTVENIDTTTGAKYAYGLYLNGDAATVNGLKVIDIDNTVTAANSRGIYMDTSDSVISGIVATLCTGTGIELAGGFSNVLTGRSGSNGTQLTDGATATNTAALISS